MARSPLAFDMVNTTVSAAGPQVLVQVVDRLADASVVGGQHRPTGGRVTRAVEDLDALGRPQDHVKGRHGVAAMRAPQQPTSPVVHCSDGGALARIVDGEVHYWLPTSQRDT